jgi:hypothetical protein
MFNITKKNIFNYILPRIQAENMIGSIAVIGVCLLTQGTVLAKVPAVADGVAQLWTDLFKDQPQLHHTGPWRNGATILQVNFEADLHSIQKVVSDTSLH